MKRSSVDSRLGRGQSGSFSPQVLEQQFRRADRERRECTVLDFAKPDNEESREEFFHSATVGGFITRPCRSVSCFQFFRGERENCSPELRTALAPFRKAHGVGCVMCATQSDHRREEVMREERRATLVPLRVDDFAAIRKALHHLPHVSDAMVAVFVPIPDHARVRKELRPERVRLFSIVDREDQQRAVPADGRYSCGQLKSISKACAHVPSKSYTGLGRTATLSKFAGAL